MNLQKIMKDQKIGTYELTNLLRYRNPDMDEIRKGLFLPILQQGFKNIESNEIEWFDVETEISEL